MATKIAYADLREPTALIDDIPVRTAPLWLRPIGYGAVAVVWLAVFAVAVIATIVALPAALSGAVGPLGAAPGFQGGGIIVAIVLVLFIGPIWGWLTAFVVPGSLGMFLDSITLLTRSLRTRYRDEQLSFSKLTKGELAGPVVATGSGALSIAVSLLPWRLTRWSKLVAIVRFNGWVPNSNWFVIGTIWGWGYVWTVGWLLWPATGAGRVAGIASSVLLLAVVVGLMVRRRQLIADVMIKPFERTVYAHSWPNRPMAKRNSPSKKKTNGSKGTKTRGPTKISAKYAAILEDQPEHYEDE